jgi:tetratricopeptide (TPR) repeat protein
MITKLKICMFLIVTVTLASCAVSRQAVKSDLSEESYYHYILASEAQFDRDWEEALKHLERALEENPDSLYLKTELSQTYLNSGDTEAAIYCSPNFM